MQRFTSFGVVMLMLVLMTPVLACAATSNMTRMEHDCCRQMHGKCGDVAGQGCCRVELRTDLNQLPAHLAAAPVLSLTTIAIAHQPFSELCASAGYPYHVPDEHSPPGLLIASTAVLRI